MVLQPSPQTGIYVHLPFCPYLCPYCDFAKEPWRRSRSERYLRALRTELTAAPSVPAQTLFLGGGTPNMYSPEHLSRLVGDIRSHFSMVDGCEITIEMNPDPQLCSGLSEYLAAGINRLSIGVQSFVPAELAALGRRHSPADVRSLVQAARRAGFVNISLDLIFAIPGQTLASLDVSLDAALALEVEHISCYGLTIEEGTPLAQRFQSHPKQFPGEAMEAELYERVIDTLTGQGFEWYEVSNFARSGKRSQHNEHYWNNGDYIGLGMGAASYRHGERIVHTRSLDEYCEALEQGRPIPGESERLLGAVQAGEAAMLALRCAKGIDLQGFSRRYGFDMYERYAAIIAELTAVGMVEVEDAHLRLTRKGRFLANDVCAAFIVMPEAA